MKRWGAAAAFALIASLLAGVVPTRAQPAAGAARYLVLFEEGADPDAGLAALRAMDARVVSVNRKVGLATVRSTDPNFARLARASRRFAGVAADRAIGRVVAPTSRPGHNLTLGGAPQHDGFSAATVDGDPLFNRQWYLGMIDAEPGGSYALERGDERVLLGIADTGVEARHLDLRANVDRDLSRSFVRDIPAIDGPCSEEPDRSCDDPVLSDPYGHGTAIASAAAAKLNGFGISGAAPDVTLVNLRLAQDSGFFFAEPFAAGLTYAADNGIDIVNMSFFTDPWVFNCPNNPADSAEEQEEQQTIIETVQRTVDYARSRGVTLITASGNFHDDLDDPGMDNLSPFLPEGAARERTLDESCLMLPQEADGVIGVGGVGPTGRKAFYSNYGFDAVDIAAPAGDWFDGEPYGPQNDMLLATSKESLKAFGLLSRTGKPKVPWVLRRCRNDRCAYFAYGFGTSNASPLVSGVAALIVSAHGQDDGAGGITMDPAEVEAALYASATAAECPDGGVQEYPEIGDAFADFGESWEDFTASCTAQGTRTNFFGHGIVNARNAVLAR